MNYKRIYDKKLYLFFSIFLLGVLVKFCYFFALDLNPGSLFLLHESVSLNLLNGNGFLVPLQEVPGNGVPLTTYPPAYSIFIAFVYFIFGQSHKAIQVSQIIIGSLGCVLFAQTIWWAFKSKTVGVLSGIALCAIPTITVLDVIPNLNASLTMFFIISALYSWFWALRSKNVFYFILPGLSLGIASMFRSEAILLIPIFALLPVLSFDKRKFFTRFLTIIFGGLVMIMPWTLRNYQTFGVFSPSGPGVGLCLVEMIGKTYPDMENGFAFGDGEIALAEGGEYTDLNWPLPYQRGRERVERAKNFIFQNPGKAAWAFVRNIPLAWFGHQLYISKGVGSLHTQLASGNLMVIVRENPLAVIDRGLGMLISLTMFILGISGIIKARHYWKRLFPFVIIAFYYISMFTLLGILGRYTIPAYVMLIPFVIIAIRKQTFKIAAE